jgi:hypothetical protein
VDVQNASGVTVLTQKVLYAPDWSVMRAKLELFRYFEWKQQFCPTVQRWTFEQQNAEENVRREVR